MEDVDVEDDDVVIWDEPLALLSMFFISAMELLISPRSCLMASVDEVVADEEADLEEDDIERWVADVSQAILHDALVVLLLVDEDVLELLVLLEVAFRSFCVIFYRHFARIFISMSTSFTRKVAIESLEFLWHLGAQITQTIPLNRVLL